MTIEQKKIRKSSRRLPKGVFTIDLPVENRAVIRAVDDLEKRIALIEKWIDFWETIETGWRKPQ